MKSDRDRKQAELTAQLRESGKPPARDLWPEIAEKIGGTVHNRTQGTERQAGGERPDVPVVDGPPSRRRRFAAVRWAVAATVAAALIWSAVQVLGPGREPRLAPVELAAVADPDPGPTTDAGELEVLDAALSEIKAALVQDPGNNGLYRMLQRTQRSRNRVMAKLAWHG